MIDYKCDSSREVPGSWRGMDNNKKVHCCS
jgi:hypothetical protein